MADAAAIASAASVGLSTNLLGGRCEQGKPYPLEKKLAVAETIRRLRNETGSDPTDKEVSELMLVGRGFVAKVKEELRVHGNVLRPDEIVQGRAKGVGSLSFDEGDETFLLLLRFLDPTRSNQSYVEHLQLHRGKVVSESLMSSWFANRFSHSGKFRVPNLIPVDKFKPDNILRYLDFVLFMSTVEDPSRLKFGDEKHLDGADLYKRKARADPLTGESAGIMVTGDFRNRCNINAIMGLDPNKPPLFVSILEETNTAASYVAFILLALEAGYFNYGDIFIIDNWTGHHNAEAAMLEDLLWNYRPFPGAPPMNILVKYLPTRSPELNPIELVFQILVQRMKRECLLCMLYRTFYMHVTPSTLSARPRHLRAITLASGGLRLPIRDSSRNLAVHPVPNPTGLASTRLSAAGIVGILRSVGDGLRFGLVLGVLFSTRGGARFGHLRRRRTGRGRQGGCWGGISCLYCASWLLRARHRTPSRWGVGRSILSFKKGKVSKKIQMFLSDVT